MAQPPPPAPLPPAPPAPRRGRRWLWLGLVAVSCTAAGALLSGKLRPVQPASPAGTRGTELAPPAPPDDTADGGSHTDLDAIDQSIRAGRYEAALARCRAAAAGAAGAALDAVDHRAALCLEGMGDLDKATTVFGTVSGRNPDGAAAAAARLGQARVRLLRGRPEEARPLLNTLLLRSALPACADAGTTADASFLLALALALEVSPDEMPGPMKPLALARPRLEIPLDQQLDRLTRVTAAAGRAGAGPATRGLRIGRLGPRPEEVQVTACTDQEPFTAFVDRLADQCGLPVRWTPEARRQTGTRTVTVAVELMPLPVLVRCLALDADLSWELAGSALSLCTAGELPERTRAARRLAAARQAVQDALLTAPDHPLAAAACLELGNLEMASGRTKEGLGWYERQLGEARRARVPAELYYNLALARDQLGDRRQASDAFYWVVDRAPGTDLAALAYYRVGRLRLEENDPGAATRPLRRAMGTAPGSDTRPAAALLLAAAALLADSPRTAYSTLAEMGTAIQDEPYRRPAVLLDALARYRSQPDAGKATREAGDLLAALLTFRAEPLLGPVGVLLAGRAYRDLGVPEEMAALYERSAPDRTGPLGAEMTADLAEYHFRAGRRAEARRAFEALAAAPGRRGPEAELRLAELDLLDHRPDDCLRRCRRLTDTTPKPAGSDLLALMGRAYTQKGDSARASRCFAGEVPE